MEENICMYEMKLGHLKYKCSLLDCGTYHSACCKKSEENCSKIKTTNNMDKLIALIKVKKTKEAYENNGNKSI